MTHFVMPVSLYMTAPVVTIAETATLTEVQRTLQDREISCIPVVDVRGLPVGVLSRTDLLEVGRMQAGARGRRALLTLPDRTAREAMHPGVITVEPDTAVAQAARVMVKRRIHRVFVAQEGRLVAVFSTKDLLVPIHEKRTPTPLAEVMSTPAFTIPTSAPLSLATDRLRDAHVSGLAVVDDEGWPVGTFTQTEGLACRDLPGSTSLEVVMSHALLCMDVRTPLHRAAAQVHATRARRILVVADRRVVGVVTGLDFARAAA